MDSPQSKQKVYEIMMELGVEINNLDEDVNSIFFSFSLASWLSFDYNIRILTYRTDSGDVPFYIIKARKNHLERSEELQLYIFVQAINHSNMTITHYIQQAPPPLRYQNLVMVRFYRHSRGLTIRIDDRNGIFEEIFDQPDRQRNLECSEFKKPNELEYRYIQPEDQRFVYQSQKEHFHIAFQGGGAKGVAYVGAYKALIDLFPNKYIRSLIGSSAGGMISLAVSAGLSIDDILGVVLSLVETANDRVIQHVEDITFEKRQHYDHVVRKIKLFLHDHGLITSRMFDLIVNETLKEDVVDKIFQVLCGANDTLRIMFSLEVDKISKSKSKTSLFSGSKTSASSTERISSPERETKLLNYYGLLQGHLLSGDGIARISASILKKFLINRFKKDPVSFCAILKIKGINQYNIEQQTLKLAENINMHQYYLLTDNLQFTVTTVDMEDKVLRCLNHKTTPFVPVCKAVQMTASYPIAFQAIRWKKQWGRYYIHYANTRKEIDLTGHQFTDGGVLSNFPMKFLDNESVRPMYFSHMSSSKTSIFGFGLQQITQEEQQQALKTSENMTQQLIKLIRKRVPLTKLIYEQIFHTPSPKFIPVRSMTCLKEIPIMNFIFNLVDVLFSATDNFVRECFGKDMYLMQSSIGLGKFLMNSEDKDKTMQRHINLKSSLESLSLQVQNYIYEEQKYIIFVKEESKRIKIPYPRVQDLVYVKNLLIVNLKFYGLYVLREKKFNYRAEMVAPAYLRVLNEIEIKFAEMLSRVQRINRHRVFRSDSLGEDVRNLLCVIDQWQALYRLTGITNLSIRKAVDANFIGFFDYMRRNTVAEIDSILLQLDRKLNDVELQTQDHKRIHDNKLAQNLSKFSHSFPFKSLEGYQVFLCCMDDLDEYILSQKKQFDANRNSIQQYIDKTIGGGESNRIHLVFESTSGITAKYYMDSYRLVNQYIFTNQTKKTSYLLEKIADRILQENERRDPNHKFTAVDLVKFIIVRSDVHKFIEKNYENLSQQVDLGYLKYTISSQLLAKINILVAKRKADTAKITSITCSSIQCYLAFLFTLGFDNTRILEEVELVKNLLQIDYLKIQKEFYQMDWAIPYKCKVRQFQESIWHSRYDMFKHMEASVRSNSLQVDMDRIKQEFERSKEEVLDTFHFVLDYVVAEQINANKSTKLSFDQYMAKKMGLRYGKKNYRKINEKIGRDTKKALQLIYKQFEALIRHLVFTYARQQSLEYLVNQKDPVRREAIWKGIIMTNLIQVNQVKIHIQDLLAEKNLPRDIRLQQYDDFCPVKITLTFTALDITSHCIEFINYHSYPQMPVWAAVLTGASYSPLISPLRTKPSWSQKIDANKELRHLKSFFNGDRWFNLPVFVSGSVLVNMPLEYLTNRKIREVYYNNEQYTFLVFGQKPQKKEYVVEELFYRKFLNLRSTLRLALNIRGIQLNLFNRAQKNIFVSQLSNDDNLTLQIYYKELLRLPIKLGTLEFVKLKQPGIIPKILEETYYYTMQKFCVKKRTCLRVLIDDNRLRIHFISKERNNKDLHKNYKIFYKHQFMQQEMELKTQVIDISDILLINELQLKFRYIDQRVLAGHMLGKYSVFETKYKISLEFLKYYEKYEGLYGFPYSTIINGAIVPLKQQIGVLRSQYSGNTFEYVFFCKSIVDLQKSGLYCELCCSLLKSKSEELSYLSSALDENCTKCNDRRNIRYYCSQTYGDCSARYCMQCCKHQIITRINDRIYCNSGHQYRFMNSLWKSNEVDYSKCDLCHELTSSYFLDEKCDTTLCQPCSAQFSPYESGF